MKLRILLAAGIFLFLALPAAVLFLSRSSSPICKENYDRIELGMPRTEVEKLLGGPPGDYYKGELVYDWVADGRKEPLTEDEAEALFLNVQGRSPSTVYDLYSALLGWEEWGSDRASISVRFEADKRVAAKKFMPVRPKAESLFAKLRL